LEEEEGELFRAEWVSYFLFSDQPAWAAQKMKQEEETDRPSGNFDKLS
jgi:hypothetical protein